MQSGTSTRNSRSSKSGRQLLLIEVIQNALRVTQRRAQNGQKRSLKYLPERRLLRRFVRRPSSDCYLHMKVTVATIFFGHAFLVSKSTNSNSLPRDAQCSLPNFEAISPTSSSSPLEGEAVADTLNMFSGSCFTDEFQTQDEEKIAADNVNTVDFVDRILFRQIGRQLGFNISLHASYNPVIRA